MCFCFLCVQPGWVQSVPRGAGGALSPQHTPPGAGEGTGPGGCPWVGTGLFPAVVAFSGQGLTDSYI